MNRIGKILLAATVALGPVTGSAQGIVRFANYGPEVNAPVTNSVTGQLVDGSGFLVQLYGEPPDLWNQFWCPSIRLRPLSQALSPVTSMAFSPPTRL